METVQKLFVVATLLIAIVSNGVLLQLSNAQSVCGIPVTSLMDCRPALTSPNPSTPTSQCCSALSRVDRPCFCNLSKNASYLKAFGIDPALVKSLPGKCKLSNFGC